MKIYIAGKITGLPRPIYERRFATAEKALKAQGHKTLNPVSIVPQNLEYEDQMSICMRLVEIADVLYMLDNWTQSSGAKREHEYAMSLGKRIIYQSSTPGW